MKNYKKLKGIKKYLQLVSLEGFLPHYVPYVDSPKGRKKVKRALKQAKDAFIKYTKG